MASRMVYGRAQVTSLTPVRGHPVAECGEPVPSAPQRTDGGQPQEIGLAHRWGRARHQRHLRPHDQDRYRVCRGKCRRGVSYLYPTNGRAHRVGGLTATTRGLYHWEMLWSLSRMTAPDAARCPCPTNTVRGVGGRVFAAGPGHRLCPGPVRSPSEMSRGAMMRP